MTNPSHTHTTRPEPGREKVGEKYMTHNNIYSYDDTYQGAGPEIIHIDTDGIQRGTDRCTRQHAMGQLRRHCQLVVDGEAAHISYYRVPQPDGSTVPGYMTDMSTAIPF